MANSERQTLVVGAGVGKDYVGERLVPVESGSKTFTFERVSGSSGIQQAESCARSVTQIGCCLQQNM
jgi:hypothetical protein